MAAATKRRSRPMLSAITRPCQRPRERWYSKGSPALKKRSECRAGTAAMPEFAYIGLDSAGRERRGSLRAETSDEARAQLVSRKLYVVRIEPSEQASAAPLLSSSLLVRKKLGAKQLTLFTR